MRNHSLSALLVGPLFIVTLSTGVVGGLWLTQLVLGLREPLARVASLKDEPLALSTEIFDRRGEKIGELASERRYYVRLKELPPHVIQAFLSAEDKDFYHHHGVSPGAILRAALANLRGQRVRQGASTITQQLARVSFLDQEKSWTRKAKEAILALAIERRLSKDEILELYLNKIYLGNRSYGIEAAARNYLRRTAATLTVAEAALLAGLPKSPARYAPHRFPKRAGARQAWVLRRMEHDGHLAKGEAQRLARQLIRVAPRAEDHWHKAPYFIAAVKKEIDRRFELDSLPRHGLRIHTTLDARLQRVAARQLAEALGQLEKSAPKRRHVKDRIEGAFIALAPRSGAVLAMQGGSSFAQSQFNRSVGAHRPMGELVIPLYVGLALERGYTPLSRPGDDPMAEGRHAKQRTPLAPTLYELVTQGRLLEGAALYLALGNGSLKDHGSRLGIGLGDDGPSAALGLAEASPLQMAQAYAPIVNGGHGVTPYLIERVTSVTGKVLYRASTESAPEARALSPQAAYIVQHLLRQAVAEGHATGAREASPLAGGMAAVSDDLHNAWFVGVLPRVVSTLWIGSERGQTRLAETPEEARRQSAALWARILKASPRGYREERTPVEIPPGLSFGRLPMAQGGRRTLPFQAGTEPRAKDGRRL